MKDFVKMVLAVICGIIVLSIISGVLTLMIFGALLAAGSGQPQLPKSGVLKLDMAKVTVSEQANASDAMAALSSLGGGGSGETVSLLDAVRAIDAAATDPSVKFIYLLTDGSATGITTCEELRKALANYRQTSGKPVIAYMETPTTGSYYLASVADKIYMTANPGATTQLVGVSSQMIFLGDLLKKLGVDVQLIRHGKYKSAGEQFTRGSASPENREQYQRMVDSIWETLRAEIAKSRDMSEEHVDDVVDNLRLCVSEDFLNEGFVDGLLTRSELEEKIAALAVQDKFKDVKFIGFSDYVDAKVTATKSKKKIAVIYADGNIVDGSAKSAVAGDRYASIISKVRADSTVKAVVLRVNSPGGSVLASDKIKSELDLLGKEKPLIASYGSYAASGGYWISNNADKIYTDATTLTGSIGVFSMIPNLENTAREIAHVGVETIGSNKHSGIFDMTHHFDEEEYNYMFRSVEDIYDRFTTIVAEGRGMTTDDVDAIGQGRVWTGADAIKINLVDEIGTLQDALGYAALTAGDSDIANWTVSEYPRPLSQMDQILDLFGQSTDTESRILGLVKDMKTPRTLARLPYDISVR